MSESIGPPHANLRRLACIMSDAGETFVANAKGAGKFERRSMVVIPAQDVPAFRELCRERLGPALREIDAWLEDRADPSGVRVGVVIFGFDDA